VGSSGEGPGYTVVDGNKRRRRQTEDEGNDGPQLEVRNDDPKLGEARERKNIALLVSCILTFYLTREKNEMFFVSPFQEKVIHRDCFVRLLIGKPYNYVYYDNTTVA